MDDFVINVRQIGQYPALTNPGAGFLTLVQQGVGGQYLSLDLKYTGGGFQGTGATDPNAGFVWEDPFTGRELMGLDSNVTALNVFGAFNATGNSFIEGALSVIGPISTNHDISALGGGQFAGPVTCADPQGINDAVTLNYLFGEFALHSVTSFNGRMGAVQLETDDILRGGGAPIWNPHFGGIVTAPTAWNASQSDDVVATTAFVQAAICNFWSLGKQLGTLVTSVNGRGGDVVLNADDITTALSVAGQYGLANTPPSGDVSRRIATTAFVDDAMYFLGQQILQEAGLVSSQLDANFAPINSPQFTGIPTAPTAAQANNSGQLATTAFVHAAVTASTTGVSSFNTRTGAVVLTTADVTSAGGAPINAPAFTGIPTAPTATPGTNTTQLATTAFVEAAIAAMATGVSSFNTRTGAVSLQASDVTAVGGALLASPAFSGTPTAPTPAAATNNTQIATTAYVTAAIAAMPAAVTSFNGRTGSVNFQASDISAVNGALLASPQFTGNPTAPTQTVGTSNTTLATTAFVMAAVTAATSGVVSFNARTGAVTLQGTDITSAGGALINGPIFTGVPAAPTAAPGTNSTQIATTAFVTAALAAATGVSSFNGRTGAVTFQGSDISAAGGALLASPSFSGAPLAPTASPGTSTTQIATTAFVAAAIAAGGGVTSFNGRAGVVTLNATDLANAGNGMVLLANVNMAGLAQQVFTLASPYRRWLLLVDSAFCSNSGGNMSLHISTDNGATFIATNYLHSAIYVATGSATSSVYQAGASSPDTALRPMANSDISQGNCTANLAAIRINGGVNRSMFQWQGSTVTAVGNFFNGGGYWTGSPIVANAIRLIPSNGGTWVTGQASLYGLVGPGV